MIERTFVHDTRHSVRIPSDPVTRFRSCSAWLADAFGPVVPATVGPKLPMEVGRACRPDPVALSGIPLRPYRPATNSALSTSEYGALAGCHRVGPRVRTRPRAVAWRKPRERRFDCSVWQPWPANEMAGLRPAKRREVGLDLLRSREWGGSSTTATRDEHAAHSSESPAGADSYEAPGARDPMCRKAQLQTAPLRISLSDSSLERGGTTRGRMGTCVAGSGRSCSSWV